MKANVTCACYNYNGTGKEQSHALVDLCTETNSSLHFYVLTKHNYRVTVTLSETHFMVLPLSICLYISQEKSLCF